MTGTCKSHSYAQLEPSLLKKLVSNVSDSAQSTLVKKLPDLSQVTPCEQDVLRLIIHGVTNREIGRQLHISKGTVKT